MALTLVLAMAVPPAAATAPKGRSTSASHALPSSAALRRSPEHALRAAPTTSGRTLVLLVIVLPGRGTEELLCSAEVASGPAYGGGDPVNSSDPSGQLVAPGYNSESCSDPSLGGTWLWTMSCAPPDQGWRGVVALAEAEVSLAGLPDADAVTGACGGLMDLARGVWDGIFGGAAEREGLLNLSAEDSWGNPSSLEDHFLRHGADFGATSADQYANDASQFLQQALKDGYPVKVDADGVIRAYDPETNTFGAYNANGTTRTFFKPTNGAAYWASQPGSTP